MRVGIIGLQHESNTFISTPTTFDLFEQEVVATGEGVRDFYGHAPHEIGGFFEGLANAGIEAVPIFAASAFPSGAIPHDTLERLLTMMFDALDGAGEIDGLLVAPHGAGVSERERDMDGYWLSLVRDKVGPDLPMICTLDPHANVSQRMIDACDATTIYRTNPHLDQKDRGLEAASLMVRTLAGEIRPTQACALPPIAINIERQLTTEAPCVPMYEAVERMRKRDGVLSASVILGFPYADVAEMGSGFVFVTDNNPKFAQDLADEMAAYLHAHRRDFIPNLIEIDDAIDMAATVDGPVCLLDMGDNVGGGSSADGTFIAHAVHRRGGPRTFVSICDAAAAKKAIDAGVGASVELSVGGHTDDMHGPPLDATFTVASVHDGKFKEDQVRHGGKTHYDMGPTAIVETDTGLVVQINSRRTVPFSLKQVTSCGLKPGDFKLLVAKGVNAPVAAYGPVVSQCIRVNTAGSTSADMNKFVYQHRRQPLFPFEEVTL